MNTESSQLEKCPNPTDICGQVFSSITEIGLFCPNCNLELVKPCPCCGSSVGYGYYKRNIDPKDVNIVLCPQCNKRVKMAFNNPLKNSNDEYNKPLIMLRCLEPKKHLA